MRAVAEIDYEDLDCFYNEDTDWILLEPVLIDGIERKLNVRYSTWRNRSDLIITDVIDFDTRRDVSWKLLCRPEVYDLIEDEILVRI